MQNRQEIGEIGNTYGSVEVGTLNGKYYWIVTGHSNDEENINDWEEISKELYDNLILHNKK